MRLPLAILTATLALSATSPSYAVELEAWDIATWGPERQAACGVALMKVGGLLALRRKDNATFNILVRGYTYNELSERSNTSMNDAAWASDLGKDNSALYNLVSRCVDYYNEDVKSGRILPADQDAGLSAFRRDYSDQVNTTE